MLKISISPRRQLSPAEQEALARVNSEIGGGVCFTLHLEADRTFLSCESSELGFKPWWIDLLQLKLVQRLDRGTRRNEAVARAVLSDEPHPLIYDATAGLGRDALVLQALGATVWMFERNPVIYLLLYDALLRAQRSSLAEKLTSGLPRLMPPGTLLEHYAALPVPAAIYYDPMFPPSRKSALVKKDMQLFHYLAGPDEDWQGYLHSLCSLGVRKVVLKRPRGEMPLKLGELEPHHCVDGQACRYDCYLPPSNGKVKNFK